MSTYLLQSSRTALLIFLFLRSDGIPTDLDLRGEGKKFVTVASNNKKKATQSDKSKDSGNDGGKDDASKTSKDKSKSTSAATNKKKD